MTPREKANGLIRRALERRYKAPEWGLLHEVPNATGGRHKRTADALAMSLWPSRGLTVHGFEIKVDRGDWLRELRDPSKSEPIQKYCDHWWIVAEKGVVDLKADAFPKTWGLLERRKSQLIRVVEAPALSPAMPDRQFLASLFRNLAAAQTNWVRRSDIADELRAHYERGLNDEKGMQEINTRSLNRKIEELERNIATFEEAAGVKLNRYNAGNIGDIVSLLRSHRPDEFVDRMKRDMQAYRSAAFQLQLAVENYLSEPCGECSSCAANLPKQCYKPKKPRLEDAA